MVHFTRLRLHGFKSFVDKTELDIAPGLNGIVGPNGCGKSNLVEALRWVMGESSAKRMRGEGMDDVIFSGTDKRASRNLAEVSLLLDNTTRSAPTAYNGNDEIEITRKIEREKGSSYRMNGRAVRARDVNMFFADSITGANSPALVSQGRVTEIIKAKPMERRLILEDSAGISGLFARRHEAELKLRGAETNLDRINDVFDSMETRLSSLKRQVQQAKRYRKLSTEIRTLERLIAVLELEQIDRDIAQTKADFNAAETKVAEQLAAVTQLTKTEATQAQDLPALRKVEAAAAAALQSSKATLQRLEDQHRHESEMKARAEEELKRLTADRAHEKKNEEETEALLEQLNSEQHDILTQQQECTAHLAKTAQESEDLQATLTASENEHATALERLAASRAKQAALHNQVTQTERRYDILKGRHVKTQNSLATLQKDATVTELGALHTALEEENRRIAQALLKARRDTEDLQEQTAKIEEQYKTAEHTRREAESALHAQSSEIDILTRFLDTHTCAADNAFPPARDSVTPDIGFEKALSRALGEALLAALNPEAPTYWRAQTRSALPDLPGDLTPLLNHVSAPPALHPALSQVGCLLDDDDPELYLNQLQPGQALVNVEGAYWRWDGFVIKEGGQTEDQTALHLAQKNKRDALLSALPDQKTKTARAGEIEKAAHAAWSAHLLALKEANAALFGQEKASSTLQIKQAQLQEKRTKADSQAEHLKTTLLQIEDDLQLIQAQLTEDKAALKASETGEHTNEERAVDSLRHSITTLRDNTQNAVRTHDLALQKQSTLRARLQAIGDERVNAKNRHIRARERLRTITDHYKNTHLTLAALPKTPTSNQDYRASLLDTISNAERQMSHAAETLATVENAVNATKADLKKSEAALGDSREARARTQAMLSAQKERRTHAVCEIQTRFSTTVPELKAQIDNTLSAAKQDGTGIEALSTERDERIKSRERMGPVNLRADQEYEALESEFGVMISERDDLLGAIEELRGGIETINVEARQRLLQAFEAVNRHFQTLFSELFIGGKAHLELVGSADPLEAGLEIFAQPPGKALQSLSLLSGGEQTMASIALIFGMFLTNPSPICVLDEIDAPLDDANVDRVCNVLETIAARGDTRFIVITHHRLTMARMTCLYGVTMQERGVSQLVSVDLQQSFDFVEAA